MNAFYLNIKDDYKHKSVEFDYNLCAKVLNALDILHVNLQHLSSFY
jgi:hypothetical protein